MSQAGKLNYLNNLDQNCGKSESTLEDTPEYTPALSVHNEKTNKRRTQLLENSNLTDKAAALMNMSFSSGALLGPLISGVFYDFFDF